MTRSIVVLGLAGLLCSCCGNEPCGVYEGEINLRDPADADKYACYTRITRGVHVNTNRGLTGFRMPYCQSIGEQLSIVYSYDLREFDLSSLVYVKGDVRIEGIPKLPDLDGLRALSYIGGDLEIRAGWGASEPEYFNEALADISGLSNVESIAGDVRIENNPKLPSCAAEALVERLVYFLGSATISGNDNSASCD